jgi:hypothetical protein
LNGVGLVKGCGGRGKRDRQIMVVAHARRTRILNANVGNRAGYDRAKVPRCGS